jgi:hypothetical protein
MAGNHERGRQLCGDGRPHQHVVTTFDAVQPKAKSLKSSNGFFPGRGRIGGHQPMPTARLSAASLAAGNGIFF